MHDPAKVRVPAYHPDTPEVRHDWAQYYDTVTAADADAGLRLKELADDGLAEETIVFYFADHGSGMPRNKRSACDSGLHVPLVVYIPEKFRDLRPPEYQPGGHSDRLVSFVDLAPTVLSLAGVEPPAWMQGHAFLGKNPTKQPFVFGFRGRMDERPDLVRSATDGRFVYVRNYMPHKLPGQHVDYMFQTPTTRVWKSLHDAGKLTPAQDAFWKPKPAEELYDLKNDPDEVRNLASDPACASDFTAASRAQQKLAADIRDVGILPEGELHMRAKGSPYDWGRDDRVYPFARVFAAADLASRDAPDAVAKLRALFGDDDSAVRYWAALGMVIRGKEAVNASASELRAAIADRSPHVGVAAAEALARYGKAADREAALKRLIELASWEKNNVFVAVAALNALDAADIKEPAIRAAIAKLPTKGKLPHPLFALRAATARRSTSAVNGPCPLYAGPIIPI